MSKISIRGNAVSGNKPSVSYTGRNSFSFQMGNYLGDESWVPPSKENINTFSRWRRKQSGDKPPKING